VVNSEGGEGTCPCGKPSIVSVNGARSCTDCLDTVISDRLSGVRTALREYYAQSAEDV
jgi:hypothetical protein